MSFSQGRGRRQKAGGAFRVVETVMSLCACGRPGTSTQVHSVSGESRWLSSSGVVLHVFVIAVVQVSHALHLQGSVRNMPRIARHLPRLQAKVTSNVNAAMGSTGKVLMGRYVSRLRLELQLKSRIAPITPQTQTGSVKYRPSLLSASNRCPIAIDIAIDLN